MKIKNAGWLARSRLMRMVSSKAWKEGIWTVGTDTGTNTGDGIGNDNGIIGNW